MTIQFNAEGLVPVITQDATTNEVLMLAYMNEAALKQTLATRKATYFSRSRQSLWIKGETSGNTQTVVSLHYDCDQDALLMRVIQQGVACHTGEKSCFFSSLLEGDQPFDLLQLETIVKDRKAHPQEGSYTNYLFTKGLDKILKKVGEETSEVIIASKNTNEELVQEASDLLYHLTVLLVEKNISYQTLFQNLKARHTQKNDTK